MAKYTIHNTTDFHLSIPIIELAIDDLGTHWKGEVVIPPQEQVILEQAQVIFEELNKRREAGVLEYYRQIPSQNPCGEISMNKEDAQVQVVNNTDKTFIVHLKDDDDNPSGISKIATIAPRGMKTLYFRELDLIKMNRWEREGSITMFAVPAIPLPIEEEEIDRFQLLDFD